MTIQGEGWNEIGDYITVVHKNVQKKICISGIKYTIADGAFDETLYSSAESVSQSNYTSGNIPGQTVSPSVVGYAGGGGTTTYTTAIDFKEDDSGFDVSYENASGTTSSNVFKYTKNGDSITEIRNVTTGKNIDVTGLLDENYEVLTEAETESIINEVFNDE